MICCLGPGGSFKEPHSAEAKEALARLRRPRRLVPGAHAQLTLHAGACADFRPSKGTRPPPPGQMHQQLPQSPPEPAVSAPHKFHTGLGTTVHFQESTENP